MTQLSSAHKLFCFGFGTSAQALAAELRPFQIQLAGTRTRVDARPDDGVALAAFSGDARRPDAANLLTGTTHLLLSIPPDVDGDLALRWFGDDLAALRSLIWIGYLSTVGVYGDTGGAWIDETAPVRPQSDRAARRVLAESQWRAFGVRTGTQIDIFRLPGIYGPGRSPIDALQAGTARRIVKPGQVFNRVHVTDIGRALACAMSAALADGRSSDASAGATYNLVDDEPAPPQDVVAYAALLLGLPPPPEVAFADAALSSMGRSFYRESKRVSNARIKAALRFNFIYPTYRDGLRAIVRGVAEPR